MKGGTTVKWRLLPLILAMALLLSGCASLFQRSYTSSAPHVEAATEEDPSVLRAESYRGLVDAVLYFVNEHLSQGVVRLYNYTSDVEADLAAACQEVTLEDPLCAYAVEEITYSCSRIVSYYEVTVSIRYSHTAAEVDSIRAVTSTSAIRAAVDEAITRFASSLTLRVSYFSGDADTLRTMASQAYYNAPQCAFGLPELSVALYPDSGPQRIVEFTFQWPGDKKTLEMRSAELSAAAEKFLSQLSLPGEAPLPLELAEAFRLGTPTVSAEGTDDPYGALTGAPATHLARTLALELLCHKAGINAVFVGGFSGGTDTCWLIAETEDGYRHLLMTEEGTQLCSDPEMTALGYLWVADLYPACPASEEPPAPSGSDLEQG